jgi:uncharacterized membrane protein YphA (DoxX/SURF4 family)
MTRPTYGGSAAGGLAARGVLTVVGAAGLIIGSFLDWLSEGPSKGTDVGADIFWSTTPKSDPNFFVSAGFVTIVLGLLVLLGLALRTGTLTRLAAVLGVIAFVLYVITLYRFKGVEYNIGDVGIGMWIVLAGGVLALIGGFLGARPTVVGPPSTTYTE